MCGTVTRELLLSAALCGFAATACADVLLVPQGLRLQAAATAPLREAAHETGRNACAQSTAKLCYDYRNGRTVFKPALALLPEINGLRRESITFKRHGVSVNYSFK